MAWYKKTLQKMLAAIEREDFDEVERILGLHNRPKVKKQVEHDISEIYFALKNYGEHLDQILIVLRSSQTLRLRKAHMKLKTNAAIECVHKFETTINHLIEEKKFLE